MIGWFYDPFPSELSEALVSDAPDIAEMHAASFPPGWGESEIEAMLNEDGVHCFVMRRANWWGSRRAIGFLMIRLVGDEAEVLTLAVNSAHRRRGFGRRLMDAALRRLHYERAAKLFLEVDEANDPARILYETLGFKVVGKRKNYYARPDGTKGTALVMQLTVS